MTWTSPTGRTLELKIGDITQEPAGAIVNAANSALAGGGGVDGAIHRAGGPAIMRELDRLRARLGGGCATGGAVATTAGDLPAEYVFHAVGPVYRDGKHNEPELLKSCHAVCLQLADELSIGRITFPAISTGVYGYPVDEAARVALPAVMEHLSSHETAVKEAVFVLFDRRSYEAFAAVLQELAR